MFCTNCGHQEDKHIFPAAHVGWGPHCSECPPTTPAAWCCYGGFSLLAGGTLSTTCNHRGGHKHFCPRRSDQNFVIENAVENKINVKRCECGATKIGSAFHSTWCPVA